MASERGAKRRRLSPPEQAVSVPGFARWNLEQTYEQKPRKNKKKDEGNRLPIKKNGIVEQVARIQEEDLDADEEDRSAESDGDGDEEKITDSQSKSRPQKPRLPHKEEVREAKEELARIAGSIAEDPEENIGLLKSLAENARSRNATVKKLALGTQLAVYKDIIPGYRIRALSNDDMQSKTSKDVRKLRGFEQGLLSGYKDYVAALSALVKRNDEGIAGVAVFCTCALLESVPHFNCRNDLIGILVGILAGRRVHPNFIKAREAIERLFRDDEEGHASLEAVSQMTKMMKARDYAMHESVLNTFLHLRLLSEFIHKASTEAVDKDENQDGKKPKQKKVFRTKRERKVLREKKEVEKEMREADAAVSYEERDKNQAEMLKLVFVAYFRILKARIDHLMGAVLECLAKYAHLINQDFFGDVLEALKDLINEAEASLLREEAEEENNNNNEEEHIDNEPAAQRDATRETLLCIITAFALLQGQSDVAKSANSLNLDLKFFITHLYRAILPLCQEPDIELSAKSTQQQHLEDPNGLDIPRAKDTTKVNVATTTVLLLRSLHAVLLPPTGTKLVAPVRVAAFTKQLFTASLHFPVKSTEAVLMLLQQVSKIHGRRIAALWNTDERKGDGVFDALGGQVESSNPFATTVWEGELLRIHFDPKVREGVKAVEKNIADSR